MCKLSIITINYNNATGLQKTMQSVLSQTAIDFEYIVVDGASTDGSYELICQYAKMPMRMPFAWVSEKDNGIYHAMNKGIQLAKGEYVQFVNSGDCLVDNQVVAKMLHAMPTCDIFIGQRISVRLDGKKRIEKNNKEVSLFTFYKSGLQHPTAYIRRRLFDTYGLYDETLKIASDWKWFLIVAGLHQAKVSFAAIPVSYFDMSGISSTQLTLSDKERRNVLENLLPPPLLAYFDANHLYLNQMERLKKYPFLYRLFWLLERIAFKFEQQNRNRWN